MHIRLALVLAMALAAIPAAPGSPPAPPPEQVTVQGASGARLRIEALDPHIVRIWVKPSGDFTRKPSLAMETAPEARSPLRKTVEAGRVTIDSGALSVAVESQTLDFAVRSDGGPVLMGNARISAPSADGPWTLTETLQPSEHLFGLGQDNHNNGRLDRRGVVRELWEGQQINSGNVTAEYPVPLLLSSGPDGHAYGVFFDDVHRLRFDLGHTQADQLRLDSDGGEIDF